MYGFMMPNNIIGNNVKNLSLTDYFIFFGYMILCIAIFLLIYKGACYLRDKNKNTKIKNSTLQSLALIATSISTLSYLSLQNKAKIDFNQIINSPNFKNAAIIFIGSFIVISLISYILKRQIKPLNISIYGIIFIIGYSLFYTPIEEKIEEKKPQDTIIKKVENKKVQEVKKEETKNISNNPNIKIEVR